MKKKNINRITQLINKTNQFNLTSKRLRIEEVIKISKKQNFFTLSGNLKDKFGDNGLVTVLIGEKKNETLNIIIWLMSCRVFNRNLEFAMFDHLIKLCKKNKIYTISGNYIKSEKNYIVKDFYKSLNFKKINDKKNSTKWEFKINNKYIKKNKIIKIKNGS